MNPCPPPPMPPTFQPKPKPGPYMVSVTGGHAPTHKHETLEQARQEAERLSKQTHNVGRAIHVLQVVATLAPTTTHQWEGESK